MFPTPPFGVRLGNGHRTESNGICQDVQLELGSIVMTIDCFLFPVGEIDLILGMALAYYSW